MTSPQAETKPARRLTYIDVAKGICIIAIVLGHMGIRDASGAKVFSRWVFQFHVPLFFIIAGLFISTRKPLSVFVREKAKRLLLPYLVTCFFIGVFILCCKLLTGSTKPPTEWSGVGVFARSVLWGSGYKSKTMPAGVYAIGAIWYLEALFLALIEVRLLIDSGLRDWHRLTIAALLCVIAVWTNRSVGHLPLNLQPALAGGLYILIGYLFRKHIGLERWRFDYLVCVALCGVFVVAGIKNWVVSLVEPMFTRGILGFMVSLCASYLVMGISRILAEKNTPLTKTLEFYGKNSLIVLCSHLCCQGLGLHLLLRLILGGCGVVLSDNGARAVCFVLQLAIAACCIALIERTTYLKRVFIG